MVSRFRIPVPGPRLHWACELVEYQCCTAAKSSRAKISKFSLLVAGDCAAPSLDDAVLDGLMARNPCTLVRRPGVRRREAKHLDASTVAAVLKAAEGLRYYRVLV
jgi:hypothetical protein